MLLITSICFISLVIVVLCQQPFNKGYQVYRVVVCLLFIISAFRSGEGLYDYKQYIYLFENYQSVFVESSFTFISWVVHTYLNSQTFYLFFIYAVIAFLLKYRGIKQLSLLLVPSIFIYFCNFYIAQELIQIRSGVAAGFILLTIKPIYERKFLYFLCFWGLAVCFHTSALLFFFVYFLNSRKINKLFWGMCLLLSYILYFTHFDLIGLLSLGSSFELVNAKLQAYGGMDETANVFSIAQIMKILISTLLLYNAGKLIRKNRYSYLLLKIMFISLCALPLFGRNAVTGTRIRDLFGIVEIVLFPMVLYLFAKQWQGKVVLLIIGGCMFIISTINLLIIN